MNRSLVARMLFVVAVTVAALLLAPTASFAHAGHDHGPVATETTKSTAGEHGLADKALEQASESGTAKVQMIVSLLPGSSGKAKIICTGGCCSAASPSCCAISVPALLGVLTPPYGKAVFVTVDSEGAGITPGTLPKPPKSPV